MLAPCPSAYNVNIIVGEIQANIRQEEEMNQKDSWNTILFPTPAVRRMLLVGLGSVVAQQMSGIDSIQYFMLFVFDNAGIKDRTTQYISLISLGLLKLLVIVVAGRLFDTYGRRPLFKNSLVGKTSVQTALLKFCLDIFFSFCLTLHECIYHDILCCFSCCTQS